MLVSSIVLACLCSFPGIFSPTNCVSFLHFFLSLNKLLQGQETTIICTLEVFGRQSFTFPNSNWDLGLRLLYYALYLLTMSKK